MRMVVGATIGLAVRSLGAGRTCWIVAALLSLACGSASVLAAETITQYPAGRSAWADMVLLSGTDSAEAKASGRRSSPERLDSSADSLQTISSGADVAFAVFSSPNFGSAEDDGSFTPADPAGAVGPVHVLTMVNGQVLIQDKVGGRLVPDTTLLAFWSSTGATTVTGPRVVYDHSVSRFVATASADAGTATSAVVLAISDTSDPTLGWTFYSIQADPLAGMWVTGINIGFNDRWITINGDMLAVGGTTFIGASMWVIEKTTALTGGPLTVEFFPVGFDVTLGLRSRGLVPCVTFGPETTQHIIDTIPGAIAGFAVLRLSTVTEDTMTGKPVWAVAAGSAVIPETGVFGVTNRFDVNQIDAHQGGTAVRIATNGSRMRSAVLRNGRLWATHSGGLPVNSVSRTSTFWYELDPLGMPFPIIQSGVIGSGLSTHHFFPSIAVNANNDVMLAFARSDPGRSVQGAVTTRTALDAPGFMEPVLTVKLGEALYLKTTDGNVLWGNFSSTMVDPIDDISMWTLQAYAAPDVGPNPEDDRWGTWWASKGLTVVGTCCQSGTCLGDREFAACEADGGTTTLLRTCADECPCDGAPCTDDLNPCTDDVCVDGVCMHVNNNANTCTDSDNCTTDACVDGACISTSIDCSDLDSDCTVGMCNAMTGICRSEMINEGLPCTDDTQFCTGAETCVAGTCESAGDPCAAGGLLCDEGGAACVECFSAADCSSGDSCTIDDCTPEGVCTHTGVCGACCLEDDGSCSDRGTLGACDTAGGTFQGLGSVCAGDANGDGRDDVCPIDVTDLPTVSEWGLVIMTMLFLIVAKLSFGRRPVASAR